MRTQATKLETGKKKRVLLFSFIALLLLASAFLFLIKAPERAYQPPAFDENAVAGMPTPDESFAYDLVSVENGFSFYAAGSIYQQADRTVKLYLTNPENSGYIILCEIVNENEKVLYRSGAIKAGEYVESLRPVCAFPNEPMNVEIRVYAYEPDTWYSKGTVFLVNKLQPW